MNNLLVNATIFIIHMLLKYHRRNISQSKQIDLLRNMSFMQNAGYDVTMNTCVIQSFNNESSVSLNTFMYSSKRMFVCSIHSYYSACVCISMSVGDLMPNEFKQRLMLGGLFRNGT